MNRHNSAARTKADAEFDDARSQSRARDKAKAEHVTPADAQHDKTSRLKAQRLAREAEKP